MPGTHRDRGGVLPVLVLFLLLAAAGGYNYWRFLQ